MLIDSADTSETLALAGLEAGGYLKVEVFDIVGEAAIHAETKAKFIFTYTPARPKYLKFKFDSIEALIYAKIKLEKKEGENTEDNSDTDEKNAINSVEGKVEKSKKFDEIEIFKPFEVDIKLFD